MRTNRSLRKERSVVLAQRVRQDIVIAIVDCMLERQGMETRFQLKTCTILNKSLLLLFWLPGSAWEPRSGRSAS